MRHRLYIGFLLLILVLMLSAIFFMQYRYANQEEDWDTFDPAPEQFPHSATMAVD